MPEPKSPFKRVRKHFDRTALKAVCEAHETEFATTYGMKLEHTPADRFWRADHPAFYAFKDNGADILAVAHLDTVIDHDKRSASFVDTQAGPVVFSGALDDRLGAYTILELLPKLGVNVDVLLTTGEESGQSTAEHFYADKDYRWMIEFDRGGTDVVMYQYEDEETTYLVKGIGTRVGSGSFSDIAFLEHLGVKGFNWGVGYRDYHGPRGHAYLEDYWMMIGQFLKFHEVCKDLTLAHTPSVPAGYGSGLWSDWRDEYVSDGTGNLVPKYGNGDWWDDDDLVSDDFNIVNGRLL